MNIFDIIPQISNDPLFKNIDRNIIIHYLKDENLELKKYISNEIIISPCVEKIQIGIIVSGFVEIMSASSTHKALLKTAGKGFMFGIANLYADKASFPSIITAKSDTEVLMISSDIFKEMLENEPEIMKNFLCFLSEKVMYLNKKIASYTAGNSECKLAYFLSDNDVDGMVKIDMNYSDIAVMLDMGRASLYRAFDKLEDEKIIERNGKNIRIIDKEKIKNYI